MKKNKTTHSPQSVFSADVPSGIRFTPGEFSQSLHQQCRTLPLSQVLGVIHRRIRRQWFFAEVVGQWVWVHSSDTLTELERSFLFELGFHWSPRRQAWQHPCGVFQSPSEREQFVRYFPAEQGSRSLEFAPHS